MNKEVLQEMALQYALGTLPDADVDAFEQRLKADRELQDVVREWQQVNEADARDCEPQEIPFHVYANVMSEIDSGAGVTRGRGKPVFWGDILTWGGWAAAACLAVALGLALMGDATRSNQDEGSDMVLYTLKSPDTPPIVALDQDQEEFQNRLMKLTELAEAYWFSRSSLPIGGVEGIEAQSFAGGFTIFDPRIKVGVIGIEHIPESRVGAYYSVWAKPSEGGDPVWAGRLNPDAGNSQLAFFDLSANAAIQELGGSVSFFVTEESSKKPERPEGRIVLSSS